MPTTPHPRALADPRGAKLQHLRQVSHLWDNFLGVPGTRFRVGLESLVGLFPLGGDAIGILLSGYIVVQALSFGLPQSLLLRMLFNVVLDGVIGSVPILGDLFDTTWKANTRNVNLLEAHLQAPTASSPASPWFWLLLLSGLLLLVASLVGLSIWVLAWVLRTFHL